MRSAVAKTRTTRAGGSGAGRQMQMQVRTRMLMRVRWRVQMPLLLWMSVNMKLANAQQSPTAPNATELNMQHLRGTQTGAEAVQGSCSYSFGPQPLRLLVCWQARWTRVACGLHG